MLAALFATCCCWPFTANAAKPAAPALGSDLAYVRVHSLAESASELPSALSAKPACVLDLRYTTATGESVAALRSALASYPNEASLFILISPSTPASVRETLNAGSRSFITLGIANPSSSPSITIKATAEEDRRAYDAFENGTPLAELVSGKIEKERYDEATLVQEFKNGNSDAVPPFPPDPTQSKTPAPGDKPEAATDDPPAPLRDKVLQRTMNLHQALLVLRR